MSTRLSTVLLLILSLNTVWFVAYSARLAFAAIGADDPTQASRVFQTGAAFANTGLALHMAAGALLTVGTPLQALPVLRNRWRALHRWFGRILVLLAVVTCVGGLIYIAEVGTIGGPWMSFWFAVYGGLMLWAAAETFRHARARRFDRHFAWATRLVILAVGSWIYRMHYGLWYLATGGLGSNEAFTGPFDQIQVVAFFVPYLLVAEVLLRRRRPAARHPSTM